MIKTYCKLFINRPVGSQILQEILLPLPNSYPHSAEYCSQETAGLKKKLYYICFSNQCIPNLLSLSPVAQIIRYYLTTRRIRQEANYITTISHTQAPEWAAANSICTLPSGLDKGSEAIYGFVAYSEDPNINIFIRKFTLETALFSIFLPPSPELFNRLFGVCFLNLVLICLDYNASTCL